MDWSEACSKMTAGQWFHDLFQRLVEFELEFSSEIMGEQAPATYLERTPEWGMNAWLLGLSVDAEHTGLAPVKMLRSRAFGKMVGTKWTYFDNAARNHPVFMALKKAQVEQIEKVWGKGFVSELIGLSGRCVTKYTPRMRGIQRDALVGAEQQGTLEFVNYLQGFQQGLGFIRHAVRRGKHPTGKREADANRRASLYILAAILSPAIDEVKGELTWGELTENLSEIVKYTLELETETVKKSLQKTGLKMGKVGRPSKRNREEE